MAPSVSAFVSLAALFVAAFAAGPCCKTCTPLLVKYYSVDLANGFCGDACVDPKKFSIYKKFEANLTLVDEDHPDCSGQFTPDRAFYTEYDSTVTLGDPSGIFAVTLDLYTPAGMPDHSCCSTPILGGINCAGKPKRMNIRGTGPYCCPLRSTEETPCPKEAATEDPTTSDAKKCVPGGECGMMGCAIQCCSDGSELCIDTVSGDPCFPDGPKCPHRPEAEKTIAV